MFNVRWLPDIQNICAGESHASTESSASDHMT